MLFIYYTFTYQNGYIEHLEKYSSVKEFDQF